MVISCDEMGMLEYWGGSTSSYEFPSNVKFQYKTQTDLYEFAKHKAKPLNLTFSQDGKFFVTMATDRKVNHLQISISIVFISLVGLITCRLEYLNF